MPKTQKILTAFNAGEWSPRLTSRVDLQKYYSACETLENFTVLPQGGTTRRSGTHYVAETKDSSVASRLIPFTFSTTDAYILEFGNLYIRVYKDGAQVTSAGVPYEITTTYTSAQVGQLQFRQSADVMYITHGSHSVKKLSRLSDASWTFSTVQFRPEPSYEKDTLLGDALTPGATTGTGINFTASSGIFLDGDVGRQIVSGSGRGIIITHTSATVVVVDILDDFASTALIPYGDWSITATVQEDVTPSLATPVGAKVTLTLTALNGWRSEDVGKYVKLNEGIVKITGFTSNLVVTGEILSPLSSTSAATAGLWTLNVASWSATEGYPSVIEFHGQNLMLANTTIQPNVIWKSVSGDFENFAEGTNDDDAAAYVIFGQNEIQWLLTGTGLICGTQGEEKVLSSTNQEPLSPTNAKIVSNTTDGSSSIPAVKIGGKVVFVQRAGRKLREYTYVFAEDEFKTVDLTRLAEHVTDGGLSEISYQKEPDSVLWCIRADGTLLGFTYLRDEEVIAWHRHTTGASGEFESVASIPITGKDQTWVIVKRTINGSTVRYVEYFNPDAHSAGTKFNQWDMLNTDSALIYNGVATTTISGADHLEGQTVNLIVDGGAHEQKTISGGNITLDREGTEIELGIPFTSIGTTMKPEVPVQGSTVQGRVMGWVEIRARLLNTLGGEINGHPVYYRTPEALLSEEPELFTGEKVFENLGYEDQGKITFKQEQPFPFTLLSLLGELEIE